MSGARKVRGYELSTNPFNGGIQCTFTHNGKYYYADLCYLTGHNHPTTECMIFKSDEQGNVTGWEELYARRYIDFSDSSLVDCIEEFISEMNDE